MKAAAFVVGSSDGPGAALMDLAKGLGFNAVLPYTGLSAAERQLSATPICFFLFPAVADVRKLAETAEAIRLSAATRLRFQPLMHLAEAPSLETIRRCVSMGFDDVVTLPVTRARAEERIQRQIGRTLVYYETSGYFGPDRRTPEASAARGGDGSAGYRRLEIVRNLLSGISVMRDELFEPAAVDPSIYH